MGRRDSKKLVEKMMKKVEDESDQPSEEREEEMNSEEEERKMEEKMETLNQDIAAMDKSAQKRIRNLELAADRYLWFPDSDSTEQVRCRCCIKKKFRSMNDALDHLKSRGHKHQVRRYVIENCKDQEKIESIKKEKKIRMNRWIEKKASKAAEKKKEKLKNLSEEEIEKRKKKFQEKKARRLARKEAN